MIVNILAVDIDNSLFDKFLITKRYEDVDYNDYEIIGISSSLYTSRIFLQNLDLFFNRFFKFDQQSKLNLDNFKIDDIENNLKEFENFNKDIQVLLKFIFAIGDRNIDFFKNIEFIKPLLVCMDKKLSTLIFKMIRMEKHDYQIVEDYKITNQPDENMQQVNDYTQKTKKLYNHIYKEIQFYSENLDKFNLKMQSYYNDNNKK